MTKSRIKLKKMQRAIKWLALFGLIFATVGITVEITSVYPMLLIIDFSTSSAFIKVALTTVFIAGLLLFSGLLLDDNIFG